MSRKGGYGGGEASAGTEVGVMVHNAMSGEHVCTINLASQEKIIDIKLAVEKEVKTPASYQTLMLDSQVLKDEEHCGGLAKEGNLKLFVTYRQVEKQDFVKAVCDGSNNIFTFSYMLANGADVNAKMDGPGRPPSLDDGIEEAQEKHLMSIAMKEATALHFAANHGLEEVVRLLLESPSFTEFNTKTKGDPEVEDGQIQMTALHIAALNGHSACCCLLLGDKRFDAVNDTVNEMFATRTALALACQKGLPKVVEMLLKDPRCTAGSVASRYHRFALARTRSRARLGY
jgi:ankyrin repeat protein